MRSEAIVGSACSNSGLALPMHWPHRSSMLVACSEWALCTSQKVTRLFPGDGEGLDWSTQSLVSSEEGPRLISQIRVRLTHVGLGSHWGLQGSVHGVSGP